MPKERVAISYTIPPPISGWNARDPLDGMQESDAVILDNVFPDTSSVILRKGFRTHSTNMGAGAIQFLMEYAGANGTRQLIAGANNKIYNATTYGVDATNITGGATITSNKWQATNIRTSGNSYMLLCNGLDTPLTWDGTTLANAAFTGFTQANASHVSNYRRRVYLIEKNTTKFWYPATDAIAGACTSFDVGTILKKGGYLIWTSSWSRISSGSIEEIFVICSNMGEILVYSGDNPGDAAWSLVGQYFLPKPLGIKSLFFLQNDLLVMTIDGIISLNQILSEALFSGDSQFTNKIRTAFNDATRNWSSNFGWETLPYPRGRQFIVNVPTVEGSQSLQYVVNSVSNAWCRYTGINASCWATLNDKPYFGGMDGKIYEFDVNNDDNGQYINASIKQAFNYLGDRSHIKRAVGAKPLLSSDLGIKFNFDVDVDFSNKVPSATVTTLGNSGSAWGSPWNSTPWASDGGNSVGDWYDLRGEGRNFALRIDGAFKNVTFSLQATHFLYEPGGVY